MAALVLSKYLVLSKFQNIFILLKSRIISLVPDLLYRHNLGFFLESIVHCGTTRWSSPKYFAIFFCHKCSGSELGVRRICTWQLSHFLALSGLSVLIKSICVCYGVFKHIMLQTLQCIQCTKFILNKHGHSFPFLFYLWCF